MLTDKGIPFADLPKNRQGPAALFRGHPFDRACRRHGIEHRLTKPNHPWTNGQVERMNRTIKEPTVRTYHDDGHVQLREHLSAFLDAYNFAKRLKTLAGLTLPTSSFVPAGKENQSALKPIHTASLRD